MVDRMLFHAWLKGEQANIMHVTSKTGWSPMPEGYKLLRKTFPLGQSVAVDKTAWDWTMPGWVLWMYLNLRLRQTVGCQAWYAAACAARFNEVAGLRCLIELPTGERILQREFGIMKSGWLLTLSLNSFAQLAQHHLAILRMGLNDYPLMWAMGDDSIIRWEVDDETLREYLGALATTGCVVKHGLRTREFAGFDFRERDIVPLYPDKHRMVLAHAEEKNMKQMLISYGILYVRAGETWFDVLWPHVQQYVLYTDLQAWSAGLIKLEILDEVLSCFKP